jgi:hypothetical protein
MMEIGGLVKSHFLADDHYGFHAEETGDFCEEMKGVW